MFVWDAILEQISNLFFFAICPEQPSAESAMGKAMVRFLRWWRARNKPLLFLLKYIFQIKVPDVLHLFFSKDVILG